MTLFQALLLVVLVVGLVLLLAVGRALGDIRNQLEDIKRKMK